MISKHLRNRGSIDVALQSLITAQNIYNQIPNNEKAISELKNKAQDLLSLIIEYALCSQKMSELSLENSQNKNLVISPSFNDNLAALSYFRGMSYAIESSQNLSPSQSVRLSIQISSLASQVLYEHFDAEKKIYQQLFNTIPQKSAQSEITPHQEYFKSPFSGAAFRLSENNQGPRHTL